MLHNPASFEREVMAAGQPVVMRGLCAQWPVVAAANHSPEALRDDILRHATTRQGQAFRGRRDFGGRYFYKGDALDGFNFDRLDLTVAQAFDEILASAADPARYTFYMGSLAADIFLPGFAADNHVPMLSRHVVPRLWTAMRRTSPATMIPPTTSPAWWPGGGVSRSIRRTPSAISMSGRSTTPWPGSRSAWPPPRSRATRATPASPLPASARHGGPISTTTSSD